jgi:uncharacterized ferritin-like protein (DUF455 family)
LFDAARDCLEAASVEDKISRTQQAARSFREGHLRVDGDAPPPLPITAPGRPPRPRLVSARDLPRRGLGSVEGRAAFLHAIAHIEFNAVDLAWDAVYRFRGMPPTYYADWVAVADDEARHFGWLHARLCDLGHDYGDFDAHDGLWQMAERTAGDGMARMALVPRVLEARGLDVTPGMITRLRQHDDETSAAILARILDEEIAHVAAGSRWFEWHCSERGLEPLPTFRALLAAHGQAVLHGPFNHAARHEAGFSRRELEALEAMARGDVTGQALASGSE